MRIETLPSPGYLSMGLRLQTEACKAISAVEILAALPGAGGKSSAAKQLSDFFTACATALSTFVDAVVPTVASRTVDKPTRSTIRIRASEGLDPRFVPAAAAFAVTGVAKVISKVEVDGPDVILTVTVPFAPADTGILVAYTQPGSTTNLRDLSGNLVASFTAAAVVNPA